MPYERKKRHMKRTKQYNIELCDKICVTRLELPALLGCGQPTADKIAEDAEAKIYIGKRLLISVDKIKMYLVENCK